MEPLTKTITEQKRSRKKDPVFAAFLLGAIAGAAAMFCTGFLYLRHNLIVSYEFPGLTADDFDDAFGNAMPAESGWLASREACSLPLPSDGRALYNWKLCNRTHARGLMDDPDHGLVLPALIPCTVSITDDPDTGHAVISRLNTSLLGVIYGGNARKVLRSGIAPEQEALVSLLADSVRKEKAQRKESEP
jgi:hypothetical protein